MGKTALITEYNPFHNGHQYHLNKSREITTNDDIIVIMNGNFTQRAEPAVLDKWARTKQALACGADLVIELPLVYGIRSAEYFAYFSAAILEKTNLISDIVFGSEIASLEIMNSIAEAFNNESTSFKEKLSVYMNKGLNYPTARRKALLNSLQEYPRLQKHDEELIRNVLESPNNILGIEYLKSLLKLNSKIKPHTIKRIGPAYYSDEVKHFDKDIASATHIRKVIYKNEKNKALNLTKKLMPKNSWEILESSLKSGEYPVSEKIQQFKLRTIDIIRRLNPAALKEYAGIDNGLENRIFQAALEIGDPADFLEAVKSKNYTESRINRKLLQIYFELDEIKMKKTSKLGPSYIRVLGVNKDKEYLLTELHKKADIPVIINPADMLRKPDINSDNFLELSLSYDIIASDLYSLLYENKQKRKARKDYHQKLIKI